MAEYGFKKLSSVDTEDSFSSETSKHIIVEDGGSIKRLNSTALSSEPFVVTFSRTTTGGDAACDKTFDEIKAAYDKGLAVFAKWVSSTADNTVLLGNLGSISTSRLDFACGYNFAGDYFEIAGCTISSANIVEVVRYSA